MPSALCSPFFAGSRPNRVNRSQGFAKKRGAVGMPRPKKSKVEATLGCRYGTTAASTGTTDVEEASASTVAEQGGRTRTDVLKAEYKEERQELAALTKLAGNLVKKKVVDVRMAEAKLRREERLDEERMKRWDAAERRDEPPPAYLQLERVYKSQVKLLEARLALSMAQTRAAEAREELKGCQLLQEQAAHAHVRDELRAACREAA